MASSKMKRVLVCLLASILCAACIPLDSIDVYCSVLQNPGSSDLQYFWLNSIIYGGIYGAYFLFILSAWPFSDRFCREYQNGIWRYLIARAGRRRYVYRCFVAAFTGGGLVAAAGGLIFLIVSSSFCPFFRERRYIEVTMFPYTSFLKSDPSIYFLIMLYLLFLTSGLQTCIALTFSAYVPLRYLVCLVPYISMFFLSRANALLAIPEKWRLNFWMSARSGPFGVWGNLILTTGVIALILIMCCYLFDRRLKWRIAHE
ncbi:hypothetical protein [Porcincola intestinalis]|uniref:Uncharacterized protein n=1 Tax=Porcincola intestinalis TaxID=2606632 RepID=A0A6L5X3X5_9FIRM|nr:hypothetical protein [Porcincola intestinalis]MCI6768499.1 hypothetical protein [Lachnospiraceae bacterium]MDD7060057.1 hypothetical protein [Porcincola intestinalis]MDY4205011.1 hypothetical protein [Porcincola intestinalis]MDY5282736.1 hypothetical protein [Porcincola intestinalis]MDY5579053.1 hypothetical protein [Porcincola intestinalis]